MDESDRERAIRRQAPDQKRDFDEAPGESEADAVREAFLKKAGTQTDSVASALSNVDTSVRSGAVTQLQQERGNHYVSRVVARAQEDRGRRGRLVGLPQSEMVQEVQQRKGAGTQLTGPARQEMEEHFGADLGSVRIHTDGEAASLSRELNAQAFTVGSDIFMAEGKFQPDHAEGQGLLAHELTHVGQQTGFGGQGVQREGEEEEEGQVQREAENEEEDEQAH
jgi:hypothetical protein